MQHDAIATIAIMVVLLLSCISGCVGIITGDAMQKSHRKVLLTISLILLIMLTGITAFNETAGLTVLIGACVMPAAIMMLWKSSVLQWLISQRIQIKTKVKI